MSTTPPPTLWTDDASKRFYLVRDGVELPPGPVRLRAGATRHLQADPAALAAYEVSREEAKAFLDARFGEYVDGAKQAVQGFLDRFRAMGQPDPSAPAPPPTPGPEVPRVGTELFALAPEEALAADPEQAARLRQLADEVDAAAANAAERFRSLLASLDRSGRRPTPPAPPRE